jgi:hypothetical protein
MARLLIGGDRRGSVETQGRGQQRLQDEEIAPDRTDLGRDLALGGVGARDRQLTDGITQPGGPDREVVVELIAGEDVPEGGDPRVEQEPAAVGPESVGRVRVAEAGRQAEQRRVDQLDPEPAGQGRADGPPAGEEARALDVVAAVVQGSDEVGDRGRVVLVVASMTRTPS